MSNRTLRGFENDLPLEDHDDLEKVRNDAFEDMRSHQFDRAMQRAQEFKEKLGKREKPDPLRQKAEGLIGFAQFTLNRYGWTFDVTKTYQFNELIEQTRQALDGGDRTALEQKVKEIDEATDHLPRMAQLLVNRFMSIQNCVAQVDPVLAANLMDELDEVEAALKSNNPQAQNKLNRFDVKLNIALDQGWWRESGRSQEGPEVPILPDGDPGGSGQVPSVRPLRDPVGGKLEQRRFGPVNNPQRHP